MEKSQVYVGMVCVVNKRTPTPIYKVKSIEGFTAELTYISGGKTVNGGSTDICVLRRPSARQLAYDEEFQQKTTRHYIVQLKVIIGGHEKTATHLIVGDYDKASAGTQALRNECMGRRISQNFLTSKRAGTVAK